MYIFEDKTQNKTYIPFNVHRQTAIVIRIAGLYTAYYGSSVGIE